jgi:isoleucyl-tRNA synthetase
VKFFTSNYTSDWKFELDTEQLFPEVQGALDLLSLEKKILAFWEEQKVFEKRVKLNQNNQRNYSFLDGPITANNPMGMHHTWGRTLKDIVQRYWSMKGYKQRFQNGFDCQGLWIEVEVEKSLGLDSKKAIENFGLDNFAEQCKERIDKYATLITNQSKRLGQWMHWDNSYYTHTDRNISAIWYFLKRCQTNGWLYKDYLPMPWCIRCGTSLSQHEQHDAYKELTHTAVYVKVPIKNQKTSKEDGNEFLLIWTTTPWTLTANTAIAVHPNHTYVKVKQKDEYLFLANTRLDQLQGEYQVIAKLPGKELIGLVYNPLFPEVKEQTLFTPLVVPWEEVGEEEGTGLVHIAPGCGAEDFTLGKEQQLEVILPIDETGIFHADFGPFTGLPVNQASKEVIKLLQDKELLYKKEQYTHRYPTCWRCHEELVFRLVEEWFLDCSEIRPKLKKAARKVKWVPAFMGKRMQDWLDNMGNWCISRKRYWGLPLPFFDCKECGSLTVVESKKELLERAIEGTEDLQELHRPWIDNVKIACPKCGSSVKKVAEVGDCWLDAGIVPFATMKYFDDRDYWQSWYPVDCVIEMREQIRLWFYSMLFMGVTLTGKSPYKKVVAYEKVYDKNGRPMHRSWGNAIWFSDAINETGADILRWIMAKQPLNQNLPFGYYLEDEVKPFFLTIWNAYSFFATLANIDQFDPKKEPFSVTNLKQRPLLDQWLLSELQLLTKKVYKNLNKPNFHESTEAFESFVDVLSTWYIRRSRRRFWQEEYSFEKVSAYQTLYITLLTLAKLLAPIVPFFSEYLYQCLTVGTTENAIESVHLCSYPKARKVLTNHELHDEMKIVMDVVKLARGIRSKNNLRLRQPLQEMLLWSKESNFTSTITKFSEAIKKELNVKRLTFVPEPKKMFNCRLKPNYKVLGPKLKKQITDLEEQLNTLDQEKIFAALNDRSKLQISLPGRKKPLLVDPYQELKVDIEPIGSLEVAVGDEYAVALETTITPELLLEGLARDIVRHIQEERKQQNLQLQDHIEIEYNTSGKLREVVEKYEDYLKNETLATSIVYNPQLKEHEKQLPHGTLFLKIWKKE